MLTLIDSFRAGSSTVFRDVVYRDGHRIYAPRFYVLPDAPALARDAAGGPAFDFLWYRAPPGEGTTPRAGGLVTLTAELAVPPEAREPTADAIRAVMGDACPPDADIVPVPFKRGTVGLTFGGEGDGASDLARVVGGGPARLSRSERATFLLDLTADGAALLWQAIDAAEDLLHVRYDLVADVRLDEVRLRVWCDAERAHALARERTATTAVTAAQVREALGVEQAAGVAIESAQPLDADHHAALESLGRRVLERALASTLFSFEGTGIGGGGGRLTADDGRVGTLRPFDRRFGAGVNFTLSEAYPVERHFVVGDVLRLDATLEALGPRVRQVTLDGGYFKTLEVKMVCTADFERDPIDTVKVTIDYDHRTAAGARVHRTGELVLQRGAEVATFHTDVASPDATSYSYRADVYFDGDPEPYRMERSGVEGNVVVMDLDVLGVRHVTVELRDVPFDRVRHAIVDLEMPPGPVSRRGILDSQTPVRSWATVVRERDDPYRYRVTWLTADERRLEEPWRESLARTLHLDAPPALRRRAHVLVMAGGSFEGVRQVVAGLVLADGSSSEELTFSGPGESHAWEPPVEDPESLRYRVTTTVVYDDGSRAVAGPVDEDRPVLVVRDRSRFTVRIVPRLLNLGGAWRMALVALEFEDGTDVAGVPGAPGPTRKTFVVREPEDEPTWTFRTSDPDRHRYRYQVTLIPQEGDRLVTPWEEAEREILVLRPPAGTP
jgi:hypothetical protein